MKKHITTLAALAVAATMNAVPLTGQDPDRRRDLEERLRTLRQEMREIEDALGRRPLLTADRLSIVGGRPRVYSMPANRAQLGVLVQTRADRETDVRGALLESVTPGSPADDAGLMAGDIITHFNGEALTGPNPDAGPGDSGPALKLIERVGEMSAGAEVEIVYERDGTSHSTTATLRRVDNRRTVSVWADPNLEWPTETWVDSLPLVRGGSRISISGRDGYMSVFLSPTWSDIELVSLNEELGPYFGTSDGLLVIRAPDNEEIDLRGGDVILNIDGRDPRSPSRALRILRSYEPGEEMTLEIMRNQRRTTVTFNIPERGDSLDFWYDRSNRRRF